MLTVFISIHLTSFILEFGRYMIQSHFFSIFHCTVGKPMGNVARVAFVNLWYRILIVIISKNRTLILYENSK